MAALEEVLPTDAEVEEIVPETRTFEVEVVEDELVGECVPVGVRLRAPAELVRKPRIDAELPYVLAAEAHLAPDAWAEAHVLAESGARRLKQQPAARQPRHVVHQLVADAQIRPGVEFEPVTMRRHRSRGGENASNCTLHRYIRPFVAAHYTIISARTAEGQGCVMTAK